MGQIKVTKNVGGIEGLCIIEPAVHGIRVAISWKRTIRKIWKKLTFTSILSKITRA